MGVGELIADVVVGIASASPLVGVAEILGAWVAEIAGDA
jgi:hypothetical protein